jgi:hypothetical protein
MTYYDLSSIIRKFTLLSLVLALFFGTLLEQNKSRQPTQWNVTSLPFLFRIEDSSLEKPESRNCNGVKNSPVGQENGLRDMKRNCRLSASMFSTKFPIGY